MLRTFDPIFFNFIVDPTYLRFFWTIRFFELKKKKKNPPSYKRICLYLQGSSWYCASTEERNKILTIIYDIFEKHGNYTGSLRMALKMEDHDLILKLFESDKIETAVKCQMGTLFLINTSEIVFFFFFYFFPNTFSLSSLLVQKGLLNSPTGINNIFLKIQNDNIPSPREKKYKGYILRQHRYYWIADELGNEEVEKATRGEWTQTFYQNIAKELDVLEPKVPEDIYKTHLEDKKAVTTVLDSAKQNLAATFVNAFVNAAFCKDNLMTVEGAGWLYKNKVINLFNSIFFFSFSSNSKIFFFFHHFEICTKKQNLGARHDVLEIFFFFFTTLKFAQKNFQNLGARHDVRCRVPRGVAAMGDRRIPERHR